MNCEEEKLLLALYEENKYNNFIKKYIKIGKNETYRMKNKIQEVVSKHMTNKMFKNIYNQTTQRNPCAQLLLGYCYNYGWRVTIDRNKAMSLYELSANQGNIFAMFLFGICYKNEQTYGIDGDIEKAYELIKRSALLGNACAQCHMGHYYTRCESKNIGNLLYIYGEQDSCDRCSGQQCGLYDWNCNEGKDYKKAVDLFEQSAKQGHIYAKYMLGRCYEYGKGVCRDLVKAMRIYESNMSRGCSLSKESFNNMNHELIKLSEELRNAKKNLLIIDSLLKKVGYDIVKIIMCYI